MCLHILMSLNAFLVFAVYWIQLLDWQGWAPLLRYILYSFFVIQIVGNHDQNKKTLFKKSPSCDATTEIRGANISLLYSVSAAMFKLHDYITKANEAFNEFWLKTAYS